MFPAAGRPRCEGFNRPCNAPLRHGETLCGACTLLRDQYDAGLALWASLGIRELEQYLAGWAAFDQWCRHHPPV